MKPSKHTTKQAAVLGLAGLSLVACLGFAHAESLFRAGIAYQTAQPYTPRSLFSLPRPATVGDLVTININHQTTILQQNNSTITREQTLEENNSKIFNNIIKRITGISQLFPSVDGLNNSHEVNLRTQNQKIYQFRDSVTCQVIQVLPNGHLVVQGRKTVFSNQEQQDLLVSGIVNPFFLNGQNTIASQQVANLQMNVIGKGQMSRQQGDGIAGKYFQFLN